MPPTLRVCSGERKQARNMHYFPARLRLLSPASPAPRHPPPCTPGNEDLFTCPPNVIHVQSYVLNRTRIIDPTGPPEPMRCPPPRPPSSPCTPSSTHPTPTPHGAPPNTKATRLAPSLAPKPHGTAASPVTIPLYSWPNGSHNNDLMSPRATRHATPTPTQPNPKHHAAPHPTQPQGTTLHAVLHHAA